MTFREEEVGELHARYPGLALQAPGVVGGRLDLHAQFEDTCFADRFEITISVNNPHSSYLPALKEVGGRTKAIAAQHGVSDLRTLHRNFDDTACVCARQAERQKCPPGYTLLEYVEALVVPYLFGLCYFEDFGRWPWPELSHGPLGLLECYARGEGAGTSDELNDVLANLRGAPNWNAFRKQLRSPSAKRACPCGSGKRFGLCHREAWKGIARMRELAAQAGTDPKKIT